MIGNKQGKAIDVLRKYTKEVALLIMCINENHPMANINLISNNIRVAFNICLDEINDILRTKEEV